MHDGKCRHPSDYDYENENEETGVPMSVRLILTNDWELFGDGSGDYFDVQHRPLDMLLDVAEAHGAKITVMAELGQQWAHEALGEKHAWAAEIAAAWREALVEGVRRGHDVQMHLHPQWLRAKYDGARWRLDTDHWLTGGLPAETLAEAFSRGKRYLEVLLRPANPDYQCIGFRAGGYCIEPSTHVIQALVRAGFLCDTSVVAGAHEPGYYDYRDAHGRRGPWEVDGRSVKHAGAGTGLLEFPVYAAPTWDVPVLRKLMGVHYGTRCAAEEREWFALKDRLNRQRYPAQQRPHRMGLARRRLPNLLLCRTVLRLDYDDLPARIFARMLARNGDSNGSSFVVATGHVKNMPNADNLHRILALARARLGEGLTHRTLSEAVQETRTSTDEHGHGESRAGM